MAQRAVAKGVVSYARPFARRRPRLRLDELEPRVAPSSLLCNVPFFGAGVMAHGAWGEGDFGVRLRPAESPDLSGNAECGVGTEHGWGHEGTRMNPPGRKDTPWRADDADSSTDSPPTIDHQPSAADFAPVVPSQIDQHGEKLQNPNSNPPAADQINPNESSSNPSNAAPFGAWDLELPEPQPQAGWDWGPPGTETGSPGLFLAARDEADGLTADSCWPAGSPADSLTRPIAHPLSAAPSTLDHQPPTIGNLPSDSPDPYAGPFIVLTEPDAGPAPRATFQYRSTDQGNTLTSQMQGGAHSAPGNTEDTEAADSE